MNLDSLLQRIRLQRSRAALTGLLLALLSGCASQSTVDPRVSKARTPHELRVMTFNLRVRTLLDGPNIWDRRRDLVAERVRAFDPDLLGTQEGLDPMEADLRQRLGDYTFLGGGRSDGRRRGETCGIFFRTVRFEKLGGGDFWLSEMPEKPGSHSWGELFPCVVTWVKLRPRDGGPSFCWFNMHLDVWSRRARAKSAELLRDRMRAIAGSTPCIVTGDFNCAPDTAPYRILLAPRQPVVAALHDAFRAAHPVPARHEGTVHFFTGWRGGSRMDWILATSHFQTIEAETDHTRGPDGYPSDHFPVTARLGWRLVKGPRS